MSVPPLRSSKEKNIAEIIKNTTPETDEDFKDSQTIIINNAAVPNIVKNHPIELEFIAHYERALRNAPRPANMSKSQYFNFLAIQLLEELGNDSPSQEMIDYAELFLKRYSRKKHKKL